MSLHFCTQNCFFVVCLFFCILYCDVNVQSVLLGKRVWNTQWVTGRSERRKREGEVKLWQNWIEKEKKGNAPAGNPTWSPQQILRIPCPFNPFVQMFFLFALTIVCLVQFLLVSVVMIFFFCFLEDASERLGQHVDEVPTELRPLHQAERNEETARLGGEQVCVCV